MEEFEQESKEFGNYIRFLNDIYRKYDIYIQLTLCEDFIEEYEKEKHNEIVRDNQYFYILFGNNAEEDIIKDFETVFGQFQKTGAPLIYTYFRQLPKGQTAA